MDARHAPALRVGVAGASEPLDRLCDALAAGGLEIRRAGAPAELGAGIGAVLFELAADENRHAAIAAVRGATAAPVVLLAPAPDQALVEWALGAGIADVLVEPYDPPLVRFALEKAVRAARYGHDAPARAARVVTVFSPKGGTGKSVTAANLAAVLARRGSARTLLVDLDLQFGDAAIMLGLQPADTVRDLVESPAALDAEKLDIHAVRHASGLDVLAAPRRPEEAELIGDDAVRSVLGVARTSRDILVVDTSPFFHASTLAALDVTDELLLVCTPDIPTVKNVRLALETVEQLALPSARVRVVLNRHGEKGGMRRDDVAEALGRRVDAVLPFDSAVPEGVNRGAPAALAPAGGFAEALRDLARTLFPDLWPAPSRSRHLLRRLVAARSA